MTSGCMKNINRSYRLRIQFSSTKTGSSESLNARLRRVSVFVLCEVCRDEKQSFSV